MQDGPAKNECIDLIVRGWHFGNTLSFFNFPLTCRGGEPRDCPSMSTLTTPNGGAWKNIRVSFRSGVRWIWPDAEHRNVHATTGWICFLCLSSSQRDPNTKEFVTDDVVKLFNRRCRGAWTAVKRYRWEVLLRYFIKIGPQIRKCPPILFRGSSVGRNKKT